MKQNSEVRTHGQGGQTAHFDTSSMQRSHKPPSFSLKASKADTSLETSGSSGKFLSGSIGRGGQNDPADLAKLADYCIAQGMPGGLARLLQKPLILAEVLERYQRDALGWSNIDGRADPGGKTIKAILKGEGKEAVAKWIKEAFESSKGTDQEKSTAPSEKQTSVLAEKQKEAQKDESAKLKKGESWIVPPLLGKSDYITQAPPSQAAGAKTLTKPQLFSHALAHYGPNGARDIQKSGNWPKHYRWKKKGPWSTYEEALNMTYWIACHNTCIYMAASGGVTGVNKNSGWNQKLAKSNVKGQTAGSQIDPQLAGGKVVVVRVNNYHSILIVGKGRDEKGEFYAFFDPGRTGTKGHNLKKNRLYIGDGRIKGGDSSYKSYSVTEVRESKTES